MEAPAAVGNFAIDKRRLKNSRIFQVISMCELVRQIRATRPGPTLNNITREGGGFSPGAQIEEKRKFRCRLLTAKRPVPHQTGDGFTVAYVLFVGQGFVQSHAEQVYAVVKRPDKEI